MRRSCCGKQLQSYFFSISTTVQRMHYNFHSAHLPFSTLIWTDYNQTLCLWFQPHTVILMDFLTLMQFRMEFVLRRLYRFLGFWSMWAWAQWVFPEPGRPTIINTWEKQDTIVRDRFTVTTLIWCLLLLGLFSYLTFTLRCCGQRRSSPLTGRKCEQRAETSRRRMPGSFWVQIYRNWTVFTKHMGKEVSTSESRRVQVKRRSKRTSILVKWQRRFSWLADELEKG